MTSIRISPLVANDFLLSDNETLSWFQKPGRYEMSAAEIAELKAEAEYQAFECDASPASTRRAYKNLLKQIEQAAA